MLILARNVGESVILVLPDGRTVTVYVTSKQKSTTEVLIRLGFVAPDDVGIWRSELCPGGVPPTHSLAEPPGNPG